MYVGAWRGTQRVSVKLRLGVPQRRRPEFSGAGE
jgi:hypothetical protein